MGEYFRPCLISEGYNEFLPYKQYLDGEHQGAKLMEHSWFYNDFVNAIAEKLYYAPMRLLWIGDYSDDEAGKFSDVIKGASFAKAYDETWGNEVYPGNALDTLETATDFLVDGKILVNHDKKLYLDYDLYYCSCADGDDEAWVTNPLSLLTAVCGGGGGNYYGTNENLVGTWALDLIEVAPKSEAGELIMNGYKACPDILFKGS